MSGGRSLLVVKCLILKLIAPGIFLKHDQVERLRHIWTKSLTAPDRLDKTEIRFAKSAVPSNVDLMKQLHSKAAKQG